VEYSEVHVLQYNDQNLSLANTAKSANNNMVTIDFSLSLMKRTLTASVRRPRGGGRSWLAPSKSATESPLFLSVLSLVSRPLSPFPLHHIPCLPSFIQIRLYGISA